MILTQPGGGDNPTWAITTFGPDPNNPLYASPGAGPHSGVARLLLDFSGSLFGCSGSLLSTGMHILTAANCVTSFVGAPLPDSGTARFVTASGTTDIAIVMYRVFPGWGGDLFSGTDLAVVFLAAMAPARPGPRWDSARAAGA
ncbi:MAG: hypothetical protein HY235_11595 [Acidobacteria bacterium]|nr:hypothetical protein [Acidobacteriota bacterium]